MNAVYYSFEKFPFSRGRLKLGQSIVDLPFSCVDTEGAFHVLFYGYKK